ncbi:MAG: MinD/ParA family protein [Nitrospiria bacterium]
MERAEVLGDQIQNPSLEQVHFPKVVAVTSGKGGVGKTNVVANLGVALSKLGKTVLVLDAALGLGNLDVLFGVIPRYTIEHVLRGQKTLSEIMMQGPCGIQILPTSSGTEDLIHLTSEQKLILLGELDRLEKRVDVLLIDTAAGISSNVLYFNTVAQEIIVIASLEPTSVTDAYAIMKVLSIRHGEKRFKLLVNMVENEREAKEVFHKLTMVADQFLDIAIEYIDFIPQDDYLRMAVCQQKAVVDIYPKSRSSLQFIQLARRVIQWPVIGIPKGNLQFLWKKLLLPEL